MCPHAIDSPTEAPKKEDCVPIDTSSPAIPGTNGQQNDESNRPAAAQPQHHSNGQAKKNPYGPRYSDFLSNTSNWSIIESTLRGELPRVRYDCSERSDVGCREEAYHAKDYHVAVEGSQQQTWPLIARNPEGHYSLKRCVPWI